MHFNLNAILLLVAKAEDASLTGADFFKGAAYEISLRSEPGCKNVQRLKLGEEGVEFNKGRGGARFRWDPEVKMGERFSGGGSSGFR